MAKCNFGQGCSRFGCNFTHPKQRKGDCNFGAKCNRPDCHFLHPTRAHRQNTTLATTGSGRGKQLATGSGKKKLQVKYAHGAYSEQFSVREYTTRIAAHVAVDASGSMSGSRTNAAIEGLEQIATDALKDDDLFGLLTFDTTVKNLHHCMPRGKVAFEKDAQNIRNNAGGCTALWDAIIHGVGELKDTQQRQHRLPKKARADRLLFEQLVITDGMDNSSSATFKQAADKIARPGLADFHFVLVGVAVDENTAQVMKELCAPRHARFIRVQSVAQLVKVLADQSQAMLKMRLQVKNGGHVKHDITGVSSAANAGAALGALSRYAPGLQSAIGNHNMLAQFGRLTLG